MLPEMWEIATNTNAVLKSIKKRAMGKRTVDVPNPATVPIITVKNAIKKNKIINSFIIRSHNSIWCKIITLYLNWINCFDLKRYFFNLVTYIISPFIEIV